MGTNLVMIHGIPGPDRMSGSGRTPVGSLSPVLPPGPSEMVTRIAYRGYQARPRKRPQLAVWRPGRGVIRTTWKWLSDGVLQLPGLVSAGNLVDRIDGDSHCAFWQPVSRTAHRSVQFDGLPSCCDQLAAGHQTIRLGDVRGQE